ncbi:unnamed protein product [Dicrocoelium dendriticum]|nr:unnamed protein product [Dicrocoelium dendriticum]
MPLSFALFWVLLVSQLLCSIAHGYLLEPQGALLRPKRWSLTEIHRCGPIKGYSCMDHETCRRRYLRKDMVCLEVYPCLSSCIFAAQLLDLERLKSQVHRLMFEGIPVNTHEDPIGYIRNITRTKLSSTVLLEEQE